FKSRKRWRRYQCCRTSGRARTADGGGDPPHSTWSSADGAQVAEHVHRARCIVPLRRQGANREIGAPKSERCRADGRGATFKPRKRRRRDQCCSTSGRARTADGGSKLPHSTWRAHKTRWWMTKNSATLRYNLG